MRTKLIIIFCAVFMATGVVLAQELEELPGLDAPEKNVEELPAAPELPVVRAGIPELKVSENKEVILDVYTIKKGDYLAKLAQKYYGDKDKWKVIYEYNKYIKNPHWVFPGDKIILPVIVDKLPEVPKAKSEKAPEELREYGNFIAPEYFEFTATITGFKDEKMMYSQADYVFIDAGKNDGIVENQKMYIYREGRNVDHPYTGEYLGNVVEKIGEIIITGDIEEDNSTAKILYSEKPVKKGDMLLLGK